MEHFRRSAQVATQIAELLRHLAKESEGKAEEKEKYNAVMNQAEQLNRNAEEYVFSAEQAENRIQELKTRTKQTKSNTGADATVESAAKESSVIKGNSGLNLSSNIDVVTQILESSSRNAPALPRVDTLQAQKTDSPTNEQSQKETLGHIAKHVLEKDRGQLSSKELSLTGEYRTRTMT